MQTNDQRFKNMSWIAIVILAFLAVYLVSWTPVYVEGDDAASVVFHATGEHVPTVGPYSPYQSGMDVVLHLLPAQESVLRPTGMVITAIAAVLTPILMYLLAFDWLGEDAVKRRWLTALFLLLATPEFFYLGLVYLPSMVAICGVVAAHLVLRRTVRHHWQSPTASIWRSPGVYLALALYALGAACRWDISTYGAVIAADIFIGMPRGNQRWTLLLRQRLIFGVIWGALALLTLVAVIWLTGYSPADILKVASNFLPGATTDKQLVGNTGGPLLESAGGLVSYFTPIAVLLVIVGLFTLIRRRESVLVPIGVGILAVLLWLSGGTPKFLLPGLPGITVCLVVGFEVLWNDIRSPMLRNAIRFVLIIGIIAIWGIGIQVDSSSAWGPGFQLRDYDRPTVNGIHLSPAIGPGLALPLSEGPRPLFGHFYVLLGGQWRNLVNTLSAEQDNAAQVATDKGLPELRTDRQNPGIAVFIKLGYSLSPNPDMQNVLVSWNLADAQGKKAVMWALQDRSAIYSKAGVEKILQAGTQDSVVIFGFPADLRKLYQLSPTSLQELGPTSAILNLKTLLQAVQ